MSRGERQRGDAPLDPEATARLGAFLAKAAGGDVAIARLDRLGGGAIQENWRLDIAVADGPMAGAHALVLRTSRPAPIAYSHSRAQEFALLGAARAAGVTVPEPLWLCEDPRVIGKPFFVMRRLRGVALGQKIVRDPAFDGLRDALAERLGEELARIHAIRPGAPGLEFLPPPERAAAPAAIAGYRAFLDDHAAPHPVLEWGLRWAERHQPPADQPVLCHRDFRTGNYMVDPESREAGGLSGILDWEFAGWGAPMADIAWFCAKCWRFGAVEREAGGIAARTPFYAGYRRVSGRDIDPVEVHFWEVTAHVRWAVIAIQQADRHLSGDERSLELAAIGRRPAEMELEILRLTELLS
ncbi:MAG: phosphotransferase family protein [Alphaproteobacteria bacterium]